MRGICNGTAIRIGIPKGRLMENTIRLFKKAGLIKKFDEKTRNLKTVDGDKEFYILRNYDIPLFVEQNSLNMGIAGYDVIIERKCNVSILADLRFGYGKFVLAVPENSDIQNLYDLKNKRIATKYPEIAKRLLSDLEPEIFTLKGSVEIAPYIYLSDAILDIKSTGKTLKENRLKVIKEFFEISAKLIVNKTFYRLNYEVVQEIRRSVENGA